MKELMMMFIIGFVIYVVRDWKNDFDPVQARNKKKADSINCFNILQEFFPFFGYLNKQQKKMFVKRVLSIVNAKYFYSRDGMVIDFKVKVLLSATIAKLTFGRKRNFKMSMYEKIGVFPGVFYSKFLETYVKGLTSVRGNIMLSWEDFMYGLENTKDKLNLGVHEFAHAYYFNYIHHSNLNFTFASYREEAEEIFNKMKANIPEKDFYFRDYAATNKHEFWAVSIEHYYENPFGLNKVYPRLYELLSQLLRLVLIELISTNRPDLASEMALEAEQIEHL